MKSFNRGLVLSLMGVVASTPSLAATDPGLNNWLSAYGQAKYSVVNIVVIGDSLASCYQPSCGTDGASSAAVRFPDQLRADFEAQGLSHGTGIIPVETMLLGPDINTSFWTLNGSYSESYIIGPAQSNLVYNNGASLVQMTPGATATLAPQTGDTLKVYCAEFTDSTSGLLVMIDGVAVGSACNAVSSTPTAQVQTFRPANGLGSHTVVLRSNATGNAYLYGAEWTIGNNGVSVHNLSVGAAAAEAFGSKVATQLAFADLIQGGTQLNITMLGTNEPGLFIPVGTYSSSLINIVQHEQAIGASVLLIAPPPLGVSPQGGQLPPYQAAVQQVAAALGAAYLDFSAWGTFAQASANGLMQADGIHLSDNGQNRLFEMIAQDILPSESASSPFNGGTLSNPLNLNLNLNPATGNAFAETVANSDSSGVSSVLYGSGACNGTSNAYWLGQTGASYHYSVPNAFALFVCNTGRFPFLVFPSGNIAVSGSSYGSTSGGWTIPSDQGGSLQVTGGLGTDTLRVAGALNSGTIQAAGTLSAGSAKVAGSLSATTVQLNITASQPQCSDSLRGTLSFIQNQGWGPDHLNVCAKAADGTLSWIVVF